MIGPQIFTVLTEFRFDVTGAILESEKLQGSVNGISEAANNALNQMRHSAISIVGYMGMAEGGVLGFFVNAIKASEKFGQSQRNLANILLNNKDMYKSIDFNSSMNLSEKLLDSMGMKAIGFGIDPTALVNQVKQIAPMIMHKGEDPMTLNRSFEISRGLLKSAPTLGIDPQNMGMQLIDMVNGKADGNNTLFNRLVADTNTFKNAGVKSSKDYNTKKPVEQLDLFQKAITEFGNQTEIVHANMTSLTNQMMNFKSLLVGQFSIFRDIGKVIANVLGKMLFYVNQWLNSQGRSIAQSMAKILEPLIRSPEQLFKNIMQMKALGGDFHLAAQITKIIGALFALESTLVFLNLASKIPLFTGFMKVLSGLTGNFGGGIVAAMTGGGGIMSIIGGVIGGIIGVISQVFLPLLFFFQIISRAFAEIQLQDTKWLADHAAQIATVVEGMASAFRKITAPIMMAMDGMANLIAWFFTFGSGTEYMLEKGQAITDLFNFIGDVFIHVISLVSGVVEVLIGTLANLSQGQFKGLFANMEGMADAGYKRVWDQYHDVAKNGEMPVANMTTNIQNLNVNNQFKENAEPDRIAFTIVEQFKKAAMNPTSSNNGITGRAAIAR